MMQRHGIQLDRSDYYMCICTDDTRMGCASGSSCSSWIGRRHQNRQCSRRVGERTTIHATCFTNFSPGPRRRGFTMSHPPRVNEDHARSHLVLAHDQHFDLYHSIHSPTSSRKDPDVFPLISLHIPSYPSISLHIPIPLRIPQHPYASLLLLNHLPLDPPIHPPRTHIILIIIPRRILHNPLPKRNINPPLRLCPLRYTMLPIMLCSPPHHYHISTFQRKFLYRCVVCFICGMTECKVPGSAEGEGGNTWVWA
jgi:hypothetical protein